MKKGKRCKRCKGLGRITFFVERIPFAGLKNISGWGTCSSCFGKGFK